MIVKSLSRHGGGTSQLLSYILRYVTEEKQAKESKEKASKDSPFVIRHNMRARSLKGYVKEFEKLESQRMHTRANQVSVYHHILSFSYKDTAHITDELLKDIAQKFIALRGENNMYVGTRHADKEHIHLHLAMSAIDLGGRSARISKADFAQVKLELDRYQKEHYPELTNSLPDHGRKSRSTTREGIEACAKNARAMDKAALLSVLEKTYAATKSKEEFLSQLKEQGYTPYYRTGALTGITNEEGRKFRLGRLGYDLEKLALLNQEKEPEEKALAELSDLRAQHTRDRTASRLEAFKVQEQEPEQQSEPDNESPELAELQSLRDGNSSRDEREQDDQPEEELQEVEEEHNGEAEKDTARDELEDSRGDRDEDDRSR